MQLEAELQGWWPATAQQRNVSHCLDMAVICYKLLMTLKAAQPGLGGRVSMNLECMSGEQRQ